MFARRTGCPCPYRCSWQSHAASPATRDEGHAASTTNSERSQKMRLLLIMLCTTTLVQPRTEFLKCTHRSNAYGAAWLARTELLARQPLSQNKNALEYASFQTVLKSNFDAPRHRRDLVPVTASARCRPLFDFHTGSTFSSTPCAWELPPSRQWMTAGGSTI